MFIKDYMKKTKIIEDPKEKDFKLTGRRKVLFETMRKLYPKGNPEMQFKMCDELHDGRIEHYINSIFNR
jgi:hypothetical protein